jgi:hypothetical protein
MTNISVVSTLTTLAPSGTLQLGDYHVNQTTIGDVKRQVEEMANVSSSCQKLWWRGYLLSNDELPLTLACVGAYYSYFICYNFHSIIGSCIYFFVDVIFITYI